jgi:superfamily I DNA and RNA helicase
LLDSEHVPPEEIAVLVAGRPKEAFYSLLKEKTLPRSAKWAVETHRVSRAVTVDTVRRFKGLEAGVVYLWGIDDLSPEADRETVYVAISRAKSRLFVAGATAACVAMIT